MIEVRKAVAEDLPLVAQCIRHLAEYEKLSHEVCFEEAWLGKHLFGKERRAEVLLGFWGQQPAGFALYFFGFSTFLGQPTIWLEDLFVDPAHRGKGIGRALMQELGRVAQSENCGRIEWSVLDWNRDAMEFYRRVGGRPQKDWIRYRLGAQEIRSLAGETRVAPAP